MVAQGYEAGGHRGRIRSRRADDRLGTIALTRLLVRALDIPVIAAGGIMDGAGIAACLLLGAQRRPARHGLHRVPGVRGRRGLPGRASGPGAAAHRHDDGDFGAARPMPGQPIHGPGEAVTARRSRPTRSPMTPARRSTPPRRPPASRDMGAQWAGQGAPMARSLPAATLVAELQVRDGASAFARGGSAPPTDDERPANAPPTTSGQHAANVDT